MFLGRGGGLVHQGLQAGVNRGAFRLEKHQQCPLVGRQPAVAADALGQPAGLGQGHGFIGDDLDLLQGKPGNGALLGGLLAVAVEQSL